MALQQPHRFEQKWFYIITQTVFVFLHAWTIFPGRDSVFLVTWMEIGRNGFTKNLFDDTLQYGLDSGDMLFQSTYRLQAFPFHSRAFQVLDSPDLTGEGESLHIGGQVVALLPQILLQPDQNDRCLWAVSPHLRIPFVPNIVIATWIIFSSIICAAS